LDETRNEVCWGLESGFVSCRDQSRTNDSFLIGCYREERTKRRVVDKAEKVIRQPLVAVDNLERRDFEAREDSGQKTLHDRPCANDELGIMLGC
jgi:hypothetical protein